ncbi:hypothetical protein XNC1_2420 [Xenorhabdus nematophila ATCC 19061]|uniref:Transposase n=1 Tax=Xenorhabdus nematophila (strain ATCC 19061 / DSM 3370 / CCUG 14189 / LMG 1036 / NCIMB 9965 / AN6) TaxID=406817 RepID=D3VGP3_XENNA|nr:hypothetical protein XNC1_2420 [Xenorhabdus nematophila ATCC 19061]CEK23321.1 hypothetical protein XNC2_2327 [Xenorhabdus nematophila AN6/1]
MSTPAYRRHDISEHVWNLPEPHLPGRKGAWGRVADDNRLLINAVFWILRTGCLGEIYRPITVIGKIRIAVFAGGGTRAYGKGYSSNSLLSRILSG